MQKKPIIAFDCDNVLCDLIPGLSDACSRFTGISLEPDEWIHYDHFINVGMTLSDLLRAIIDHKILERAPPYAGVVDAILLAREQGFAVALITARGYHPHGDPITLSWLKEFGMEFDHVILVDINETKAEALKSLDNVVAYIDDYLPHLHDLEIANAGVPLFLMDQPWNREDSKFQRVFSVHEYVECAFELHNDSICQANTHASLA